MFSIVCCIINSPHFHKFACDLHFVINEKTFQKLATADDPKLPDKIVHFKIFIFKLYWSLTLFLSFTTTTFVMGTVNGFLLITYS